MLLAPRGDPMTTTPPWHDADFRLVIGRTTVDYDLKKEDANQKKHGYSLESATHFLARLLLPIDKSPFVTRETDSAGERRHEHMTIDDGKVVFFVTTMRPDETVRVISLRRANANERAVFADITGFHE
jgi:uncharacterized DUF497 family protein